jgi:hypothetical protein
MDTEIVIHEESPIKVLSEKNENQLVNLKNDISKDEHPV